LTAARRRRRLVAADPLACDAAVKLEFRLGSKVCGLPFVVSRESRSSSSG
jgi:hypothetical protein